MSLFPEVDEEIKEIKTIEKQKINLLIKLSEKYRPSNGTDGDIFYSNFCDKCGKEDIEKEKYCETLNCLFGGESEDVRSISNTVFCLQDTNFDINNFPIEEMKVIFLDIDGVLNIMSDSYRTFANNDRMEHIEVIPTKRLNYLIKKTDSCVVISSSWRFIMEQLEESLKVNGFEYWEKVIGSTGNKSEFRGDQIQDWLNDNPNVSNYVVLEDEIIDVCGDYCNTIPRDRVVEVDMKNALTSENIDEALNILESA